MLYFQTKFFSSFLAVSSLLFSSIFSIISPEIYNSNNNKEYMGFWAYLVKRSAEKNI